MKSKLRILGMVGFILSGMSARGDCWVDTYWPLNGGDQWSFTRNVTVGTDHQGGGEYDVWQETDDDYVYEVHLKWQGRVYLDCADAGWVRVCFSPRVLLFDGDLFKNGGSRTTRTTAEQSGVDYPATFTVSVSKAGTVRVPAGTFMNCRNITVKETAYPPGQPSVSATVLTAVLAPGVGLIKKQVVIDDRFVWVELTGGTVGGVSAGEWANRSGNLPPDITSHPRNTTASKDDVATLSVSTAGQGLTYEWFRGGTPLSDDGRVSGSETATLTIDPVQTSDAGNYTVRVSNGDCEVTSSSATLSVNPFPPVAGIYIGLFFAPDEVEHGSSGFFTATVRPNGAYSGALLLAGTKLSVSGQLGLDGVATNLVVPRGGDPISILWAVDLQGGNQVTGLVSTANWEAGLEGDRAVFNSRLDPAPLAGKYTFIIPGIPDQSDKPEGDGFGVATVDAGGKVKFKGTLADGTKFSAGAVMSQSGMAPLYAALYKKGGSILSWLSFDTNQPNDDLNGLLSWIRPPGPKPKSYPDGFELSTTLTGSLYLRPGANSRVVELDDGLVVFSGGGLTDPSTNPVTIGATSKVTSTGPNKLTFKFTTSSGLFKGTLVQEGITEKMKFAGAVLQKSRRGSGFFLSADLSGRVAIESEP